MWLLVFSSALAAPVTAWVGSTRSKGDSPIQLCLRPSADGVLAELWWAAFDRVSFEANLPVREGCEGDRLAGGRARLEGRCRSVQERVSDRHPVYDYVERSELRCVLGDEQAWCRLPYTDWFALRPAPEGCVAARR